jgi:branched-chain amino acid transport system substrate-binding protein
MENNNLNSEESFKKNVTLTKSMKKRYLGILVILVVVIILANLSYFNNWGGDIKIGAVLPLSGYAEFMGTEMQRGMEMCNPGNIKYIYEDSVGSATTGVSAYSKLTQIDNVDVVVVGMSTVVPAILPIAKENKDFVIATIVTAAEVGKKGGDTVFRYYLDGYGVGQIIADSMVKLDAKKIGIMYVQNEFGITYKDGAQDFLDERGVSVYSESFQATETDFSTQLLKLKQNKVDFILVIAYDKQTLQVISKIKELDLEASIFSAWMWQDSDFENNKDILSDTYNTRSSYMFGLNKDAVKFNEDFKTKFGSNPSQFSAIGCDLSLLIGKNNLNTPEKLNALKVLNGINGEIEQGQYGELNFPVKVIQFVEDEVIIIE